MKPLLFASTLLLTASFTAQAANVVASIKPIQLITQEILGETATPEALLAANASPHDYAMKPSDVKKIHAADLIVWYGKDLEPFLAKVLKDRPHVLTISDIEGLSLREFGDTHDDHHDHDGHDHGSHDPHFWLGYKPTEQVAEAIAQSLSAIDQENSATYKVNLAKFKEKLAKQQGEIEQQLSSVKHSGYYVFHDAYGYFEQDFDLNQLGHFTVSPERKPGAKTLISIKKALRASKAKCVFSEPQFTPAVVESVVRGSSANIGVLDPLGTDVVVQEGGYFDFKQSLADSFYNCLK
jgi:zinc transport system substrate-binding protein